MKKPNLHWLNKFVAQVKARVDESGAQYKAYGIFGTLNFPIYYFIWLHGSPQTYESGFLRLTNTLLCFLLIFHEKWPEKLKQYLPLYWYFTLTFTLPFFFTYMLIMNHGSEMWVTNTIVIVFFMLLLVDWISSVVLLAIGSLVGVLIGYLFASRPIFEANFDFFGFFITYAVATIIGMIFAHNKEILGEARLNTIRTMGAAIAHELRTPLRSIDAGIQGVQQYLPDLVKTYEIAKNANLEIPYIPPSDCKSLHTVFNETEVETKAIFNIIDMLLVKADLSRIDKTDFKVCSIKACLSDVSARYHFDVGQKELVHIEDQKDFNFKGNPVLVSHVFFNLMQNALYYVKAAGKGEITIKFEQQENSNVVYFKDTGTGISSQSLPHIFDKFYSTTTHGTGVGLAFCKLVMKSMDGDIVCHSKEGVYTEFVLTFPKINH